jgi:fructose-1-phosphate kinase PfkB-like protein
MQGREIRGLSGDSDHNHDTIYDNYKQLIDKPEVSCGGCGVDVSEYLNRLEPDLS